MHNEIEVKIALEADKVPAIRHHLAEQAVINYSKEKLANTYFDTPELDFARQHMGLRVRSVNDTHEMTLKMKGEIVGGLHIRPEYNLPLSSNQPDFMRLLETYQLSIDGGERIARRLFATFDTDFLREKWLIDYQQSRIEVALDLGWVSNPFGKEPICEVEFELINGDVSELLAFLQTLPALDGIWFSSLSKAERGYLVGCEEKITQKIAELLCCDWQTFEGSKRYQFSQRVADFLRLVPNHPDLTRLFIELESHCETTLQTYLKSTLFFRQNLERLSELV